MVIKEAIPVESAVVAAAREQVLSAYSVAASVELVLDSQTAWTA